MILVLAAWNPSTPREIREDWDPDPRGGKRSAQPDVGARSNSAIPVAETNDKCLIINRLNPLICNRVCLIGDLKQAPCEYKRKKVDNISIDAIVL